jgi:hypothetical protein
VNSPCSGSLPGGILGFDSAEALPATDAEGAAEAEGGAEATASGLAEFAVLFAALFAALFATLFVIAALETKSADDCAGTEGSGSGGKGRSLHPTKVNVKDAKTAEKYDLYLNIMNIS